MQHAAALPFALAVLADITGVASVATRATAQQPGWYTAHVAPEPSTALLAAIPADERLLAVAARAGRTTFETWEWVGRWQQRAPRQAPPARVGAAMACDTTRSTVVLFGGLDFNGSRNDTWEWDGIDWRDVRPAAAPPPRQFGALAFDAPRRRIVLYGGSTLATTFGDHWEWDGTSWQQRPAGATHPGPRTNSAMTFDTARNRLVLFGGTLVTSSVWFDDVWEHDGVQWTHSTPTVHPPGEGGPAMTFDPVAGRAVLTGGGFGANPNSAVWDWDGVQWRQSTSAVTPGRTVAPALAYDIARGRLVLHGGSTATATWLWDRAAASWSRVPYEVPSPSGAMVANEWNGRTLCIANRETMEWDHGAAGWIRRPTLTQPPNGILPIAYDVLRGQAVVFEPTGTTARTWIWDRGLGDWQLRTPAASPPGIQYAAMAFDLNRGRTILFGGMPPNFSAQTWEWDGSTWLLQQPANMPPGRVAAAMAFDLVSGRTVLFGGFTSAGIADDVWEWDGVDWRRRTTGSGPAARRGMALCTSQSGVLMLGGEDDRGTQLNDVWLLTGATWTRLPPCPTSIGAYARAVFAFSQGELVVFGSGLGINADPGAVAVFGVPRTAVTSLGGGCAGSAGVPGLQARGLPSLGNAAFAVDAALLPPLQPCVFAAGVELARVDLGPCRLFVAPSALAFAPVAAAGTATLPLPIPLSPSFAGSEIRVQAAALDPAAPAGLALTPALQLRVGR